MLETVDQYFNLELQAAAADLHRVYVYTSVGVRTPGDEVCAEN